MSLTTIDNQPVSFSRGEVIVECQDSEVPAYFTQEQDIILQFGVGRCPDAADLLNGLNADNWFSDEGWFFPAEGGACAVSVGFVEEIGWTPTAGNWYEVIVEVSSISGGGVSVSFGSFSQFIQSPGTHRIIGQALGSEPLRLTTFDTGINICIASVEAYEFGTSWALEVRECKGEVIGEYDLNETPENFIILGSNVQFLLPAASVGADGCFNIVLIDQCEEEPVEYISNALRVGGCKNLVPMRVCLDEGAFGLDAGRFNFALPCSLIRPQWNYDVAEERLSNGAINRTFIDRQEQWQLSVERVPYWMHRFLAALPLYDHFYFGDKSWIVDAGGYAPDFGDVQTGMGSALLTVREKKSLVRRLRCAEEGPGCDPANDPICNEADATVSMAWQAPELFVRVDILSFNGFIVEEIQWTLNGVAQDAVLVGGVGPYALGPVEEGDVVQVTLVNADNVLCNDVRAAFEATVPACPSTGLRVTVTDETDAAVNVLGSDGHVTLVSPLGTIDVRDNDNAQWDLTELGAWCVYPSDVNGNPSGSWDYLGIGFGGVAPVDLSPLNGSGPMADPTDIESIYIESVPWPSVELPLLIGTNAPFRLNSSTVTTVTVPPSTKFRAVEVGAPINSASVDALCNSLDPTVTGQATQFVGTAPATAASLPNRLAYIANGNTITFTA